MPNNLDPYWRRVWPWMDILGGFQLIYNGRIVDHVYRSDGGWRAFPDTFLSLRDAKDQAERRSGMEQLMRQTKDVKPTYAYVGGVKSQERR